MNRRGPVLEWLRRGTTGALFAAALLVEPASAAAQAVYERLAPIDLTGTWVSVVTEDWHLRMITPKPGEFEGLPLNDEAKKIAEAWTPSRDARDACKAYGAPSIMRVPGRVKISWQDGGRALKIETDAGQQTRLLHFDGAPPRGQAGWQGYSAASWEYSRGFDPLVPPAADDAPGSAGPSSRRHAQGRHHKPEAWLSQKERRAVQRAGHRHRVFRDRARSARHTLARHHEHRQRSQVPPARLRHQQQFQEGARRVEVASDPLLR